MDHLHQHVEHKQRVLLGHHAAHEKQNPAVLTEIEGSDKLAGSISREVGGSMP